MNNSNPRSSSVSVGQYPKKYFKAYQEPLLPLPNLVQDQKQSFDRLLKEGIKEVFQEFSPIKDFSEKKFELEFEDIEIGEPAITEQEAKEHKLSYEAPLKVKVKLKNKVMGTEKEQEIFMSEVPVMTKNVTFIISGIERVIIPQLARSFGVFFSASLIKGERYFGAKVIPLRGAWIEIESEPDEVLYVRLDRKKKIPVTSLLRVLGAKTDKEIKELFSGNEKALNSIEKTLQKDPSKDINDAAVELYKRLRDGDVATPENAIAFIRSLFSSDRYDFSKVGRFRFNQRFNLSLDEKEISKKEITVEDLALIVGNIVELNNDPQAEEDDIDHLGSRRVRYFDETFQQKMRVGMAQMKRNIQNRMSTIETEMTLPVNFISPKPLQARIKEFFTTNQLSQFMQQENALTEIEHLRTLSALGPGGLNRARASFEVRDVYPSHYGRLCPVHTPEGANIGLILRLTLYARVNEFGMIESPYAKVKNGAVTGEISYLSALEEEKYNIAHAAAPRDESGRFMDKEIPVRVRGAHNMVKPTEVDYVDVATTQAFSVATCMIPFLSHDDANRALMGSNMQKQAVPCIDPEAPIVATGVEEQAVKDMGRVICAEEAGEITYVDARKIVMKTKTGKERSYPLIRFSKTNSFTCFHQRPSVSLGQKVKKGDILADISSSDNGQIALGQNVFVAFMSWSGANYEDAIIISERLIKKSKFTSIHIEEFVVYVRDTKLGPEVTTCDIPNVGEAKLRNLDEDGVIRVGAEVETGDILVGKITPKGETQLTPEERLLRSLFGEKARDVKDTSKRIEGGKKGRVIGIKVFSRENGDKLESGIIKRIHIEVAQIRNIIVGDKLAGRHGNKGVISKVLPEEDMPYMPDGTPVDVILTPLGIPSRMNLGQILEMHLGMAANTLNYQAIVPPFAGASAEEIKDELESIGFDRDGKTPLYDGRTGEKFDQNVAVGYMYILKLHHMVEDKIHMRFIGPYSLITQQPLGGKAQNGGQRLGEMEVWALLGYGTAYNLREMLTIKSDDINGRSAAFDAMVKGEPIKQLNTPASFNVLLHTLRGIALDIELKKD
ncbi:MAG: DNA-directed RNA polymerase subunit beta [Patescibacteria group bacterium]